MFRFFVIILVSSFISFASGIEPINVLNFSAVNSGNDISKQNDTVWIATNGGLAQFSYSSGNFITVHHSEYQFPEISLSALHADNDGLWIGSENGYLYCRTKNKKQKIYDDLFIIKSKINAIKSFENYLIIGHEKGISVFDKKKEHIISTKQNFPVFGSGGVNLIEIKNDTIWVAIKSGYSSYSGYKNAVAKLENFSSYINNPKFGDNSPLASQVPWKTLDNSLDSLSEIKTLTYQNGIKYFENFVLFGENYRIESKKIETKEFDCWRIDPITKIKYLITKYDNNSGNELANFLFDSDINFLKFIDGKIAAGTKFDYSWFVNFGNDKCLVIPGFVNNTNIEKLFVDSEQSLWVMPSITREDEWWNAVARLSKDNKISHYKYTEEFGYTSNGCSDFTAVAQSGNKMYFGYCGDPLREYDINTNSWGVWVLDIWSTWIYANYPSFVSNWKKNCNEYYWLKVDALITDKNGVIWGTYWRNSTIGPGVEMPIIFAFNPEKKQFRYLLISGRDDLVFPNNLALSGKNENYLLLGFRGKDELWIIDANNPFDPAIEPINYRKDTVFIGDNLTKMQTTGAGNVLIGTNGEPKIFNNFSKPKIVSIKNLPERFNGQTKDIVLEYVTESWGDYEGQSRIRNIFWIANEKIGAERVVIDEYMSKNGTLLDSAVYDAEQTVFQFSVLNGSINQDISVLAIDSIQNLLWLGGEKGITRIRLPERGTNYSKAKFDFVFPNPYSLSRHNSLSIPNFSQNSMVDIYTISGKLVKHIDENSAEWIKTIDGSYTYKWKIPQNTAPGIYIVAVKSIDGDKVVNKNTKLYKLVVIP